jgi:cytochrome P450
LLEPSSHETRLQAGAGSETDLIASLMYEKVWGRTLSNEEVASILRNWTVGEIGAISAAVGILAEFVASHPDVQSQLRSQRELLPAAIDEILRLHGPLVANRRVTTQPVELGGRLARASAFRSTGFRRTAMKVFSTIRTRSVVGLYPIANPNLPAENIAVIP